MSFLNDKTTYIMLFTKKILFAVRFRRKTDKHTVWALCIADECNSRWFSL